MKKILLLWLLSFPLWAAVTETQAREVYARVQAASGLRTPLSIVNDERTSANSNANRVQITVKMLKFIVNTDELALVFGHELAHIKLRHYTMSKSVENEKQADLLGRLYAAKAGYNTCRGAGIQRRLGADDDHPTPNTRYDYLRRGC